MGIFNNSEPDSNDVAQRLFDSAVALNLRHPINCGIGAFISCGLIGFGLLLPSPFDGIVSWAALGGFLYSLVMLGVGYHRTLPATLNGS